MAAETGTTQDDVRRQIATERDELAQAVMDLRSGMGRATDVSALARRYVGADPATVSDDTIVQFQDRIMFGSDFPLIPYDYDEERRWAWARNLPIDVQRKIFYENAATFLGLP